jgi:hypothetical protein
MQLLIVIVGGVGQLDEEDEVALPPVRVIPDRRSVHRLGHVQWLIRLVLS